LGTLEQIAARLTDVVAHTGPFAPVVLLVASFIEYVFPPFPGDTIVLLGAWYAVHGTLSWPTAFLAVTAGAVCGAVVDWEIGRVLGARLEHGSGLGRLDAARLARFEDSYRRWGAWLLLANRFLPGIRAFLFIAAGAAGIPLGRVVLLGAISAALWNVVLLAAGALVAKNLPELLALLSQYTHAVWGVLALVVTVLLARVVWKRRRPG
jgi:membrane-associated protein